MTKFDKITSALSKIGRKAKGWRTTAAGLVLAGFGGYLLYLGHQDAGIGAIGSGLLFVFGVADADEDNA